MATHANPDSLQALIDDARRTVAIAAWKRTLIEVDVEARALASRHAGSVVPLAEMKEHLLRLAAELQVPAAIG